MVKKFFKKVIPLIMATTMALSMSIAFADTNYTLDIIGTKTAQVYKHIVMNDGATVPTETFSFTITPVTTNLPENVSAGLDGATVNTVSFDNNVTKNTNIENYPELGDVSNEQQVVTKNFELNFENVQFTKPGIYRYLLKETNNATKGMEYDSDEKFVDVYVENNVQSDPEAYGLKITAIVIHQDSDAAYDYNESYNKDDNFYAEIGKDEGFVNEWKTYDLSLEKLLAGNQANMVDHFKFTIEIDTTENAATKSESGDPVVVDYDIVVTSGTIADAPQTVTVTNGKGSAEVSLGHNDKITIKNLPVGAKVTITETNTGLYTASYQIDDQNKDTLGDIEIIDADVNVVVTNTLEGTIPTGVFLAVGPMFAVVAIGAIGMVITKKNRKEDEED